jgi:hypothetical protein
MAIHAKNRRIIENHIERHEEFKIASMRAERLERNSIVHFGQLPQNWRSTYTRDVSDDSVYVVYSYATPIGWVKLDGKNEWTIPDVHYSSTTSGHKSILRYASR